MGHFDNLKKHIACMIFILLMSVNHVNQAAAVLEVCNICRIRLLQLLGSREIFDLELDMWVVVNV